MYDELVKRLKEDKSWVEQGTTQTEHEIAEHIQQAADAIEELTGFVQEAERDRDEYRERLDKANDAIEKLSKKYLASEVDNTNLTGWLAEEHAKNRWIPVTERLPEEYKDVLCYYEYFRYGDYNCMFRTIDRGYYGNGRWGGEAGQGNKNKVLAWMPLPEPYEPPKEE